MKQTFPIALLIAAFFSISMEAQESPPMKYEVLKSMPAFYEELKGTLTYAKVTVDQEKTQIYNIFSLLNKTYHT